MAGLSSPRAVWIIAAAVRAFRPERILVSAVGWGRLRRMASSVASISSAGSSVFRIRWMAPSKLPCGSNFGFFRMALLQHLKTVFPVGKFLERDLRCGRVENKGILSLRL